MKTRTPLVNGALGPSEGVIATHPLGEMLAALTGAYRVLVGIVSLRSRERSDRRFSAAVVGHVYDVGRLNEVQRFS